MVEANNMAELMYCYAEMDAVTSQTEALPSLVENAANERYTANKVPPQKKFHK